MAKNTPPRACLADAGVPQEVLDRLQKVMPDLKKAQAQVAAGQRNLDTPERARGYEKRQDQRRGVAMLAGLTDRRMESTFERKIGEDEILRIGFLCAGLLAARSIGRIAVSGGVKMGTGFLVSPTMVMTNHHVLETKDQAGAATIDFEEIDFLGEHRSTMSCDFDPERFFCSNKEFDVAVVALKDEEGQRARLRGLGWHPMVGQQGKIRIGDPVNIIQYPGGRMKSVVMHNSHLLHLRDDDDDLAPFCWYSSDTERGSSGSPVFNNAWEVIGVHHRSIPKTNARDEILDMAGEPMSDEAFERDPDRAAYAANEGVRTSRVVSALQHWEDWAKPPEGMRELRDGLLALWESARLRNLGQEAAREGAREGLGAPSGTFESLGGPISVGRGAGRGPININLHFSSDR